MKKYTIYCSEEQTRKALELGAPIEIVDECRATPKQKTYCVYDILNWRYLVRPSAEQMIGFLEEILGEYSSVYVKQDSQGWWSAYVYDNCNYRIFYNDEYHSRKEATLAAIDAALNYLTKEKIN